MFRKLRNFDKSNNVVSLEKQGLKVLQLKL